MSIGKQYNERGTWVIVNKETEEIKEYCRTKGYANCRLLKLHDKDKYYIRRNNAKKQ